MNLEERTQALLALVESFRLQRQAEILGPAQAQARELMRTARSDARRRLHVAVLEARERLRTELESARAALHTARRTAAQQRARIEIAHAWRLLREELIRRWRTAALRAAWTTHHLQSAHSILPAGQWQVVYAPEWLPEERASAAELLCTQGVAPIEFIADPAMGAGLRVSSGRNLVDASLDGLLADRTAVEGELLRLLVSMDAERITPARDGAARPKKQEQAA